MATIIKLTKAALDALPLPGEGARSVYSFDGYPSLQLRVTSTGAKTFSVLRRVQNGEPERVTVGRFDKGMTIEQVKVKFAELNSLFASGKNPAEIKRGFKKEMTFADLFKEFIERHAKANKSWREYQQRYDQYISKPLAKKKLSEITRQDMGRIHSNITLAGHPVVANRVLAIASSAFNRGIEWGHLDTNPAEGITRNDEKKRARKRFLLPGELPRFFSALAEEENEAIRDYFLISILTGARRANVLAMRWRDVRLDEAIWNIPITKNGEPQDVTLSPEAIEILTARKQKATKGSVYVFPGTGKTGHLVEPKKGLKRIFDRDELAQIKALIAEAGGKFEPLYDRYETLEQELARAHVAAKLLNVQTSDLRIDDLRIHDLRRTLGSWQARTGASLVVIGKSLNHKSTQSTAVYARLDLDPVRQSVNTATAAIMEAAGVTKTADIVPIKKVV